MKNNKDRSIKFTKAKLQSLKHTDKLQKFFDLQCQGLCLFVQPAPSLNKSFYGNWGLGKIDAIITQDDFSDKVVTAYQENRENDVAMDITHAILERIKKKEKPVPLNDFEKYCLDNNIDPYLQTK